MKDSVWGLGLESRIRVQLRFGGLTLSQVRGHMVRTHPEVKD